MDNTPNLPKDKSKLQEDCLNLIESLGIYELRALTRVFGGKSPTTLKRNDHILFVMDKIMSGEDIKPIPLHQGRPHKELSNIEGILNQLSQITGKDYSTKSNQERRPTIMRVVNFKQVQEDLVKQRLFPIEARGILCRKNEKEFFFVNQDNGEIVLVKKDLDYRLKPNDYVVGTAVVMNGENEYILDSIKSINYQSEKKYDDSESKIVPESPEDFEFENKTINLGSRYVISTTKLEEKAEQIKDLVAKLRAQNVVSIALVPNMMQEDFSIYQSLGFSNSLYFKYDEKPTQIYEQFALLIEHIKRLQSLKIKAALFVEDAVTLANTLDFALKNGLKNYMNHAETTVEAIKNLMLLARQGKTVNTTIFTTCDASDLCDPMFVSAVYKISKKLDI